MGLIDTFFGKAINKRVQTLTTSFLTQASTNLFNDSLFRWLGDGVPVFQRQQFDFIEKGYNAVGAVYECVDIIQKKVVACPRIVYRVKDEKEYKKYLNYSKSAETFGKAMIAKAKGLEEVSMPKIEQLLENPNDQQNGDDIMEYLSGLLLLKGNSYLYGTGSNPSTKKWSQLYGLPTEMTIISGGPMQPVKEYVVQLWDSPPIPAAQMKHFKTFNPNYDPQGRQLYGLAPLTAYLYQMDIIKNGDIQADKQLKNGGKLGLLTPENKEDQWSDDQKGDLHEGLTEGMQSKAPMARIIPISVGVKWTEIGLDPAQLQLLEITGAKADDIYRCFHIPLQFRSQDSATYNNLPVANRKFIFDAVAPICRKIEIGLTEFICKPYNTGTEKYVIHLDYMSLPELSSDMVAAVTWLQNSPFLTMNEKREVLGYGKSFEPGMDLIMVNRNTVFLQDVLSGKIDQTQNGQSGSNLVD